jgi:ATP-dependent helicase/nuclease subunit B
MSITPNFPQVPLTEIFANRGAGVEAGCTVVTPNRRLAIALKREFGAFQAGRGFSAWESADILPISAFIERLYEEVLYSVNGAELPILLTSAQEQVLWEEAVVCSGSGRSLLGVTEAAHLAREAWQLAHEWQLVPRLASFPLNEDCKAFRSWSRYYKNVTARSGQTDHVRLYTLMAGLCNSDSVNKPKRLFCYGFDILTPQHAELLTKLEQAGCEVLLVSPVIRWTAGAPQDVGRMVCSDYREEIYLAANWARERLEKNPTARIGIVVPQLSLYRSMISRIFKAVMDPDIHRSLPGADGELPFNLSLGMPLVSYPLVNAAFLVLEFTGGEIEFERVSVLLRSPFLGDGETEMFQRARLDAELRKRAEPRITIDRLLALIEREYENTACPALIKLLCDWAGFSKTALSGLQRPSMLARAISEVLSIVGFPGQRTLDSSEFQTLKKWQEVLSNLAALDNVLPNTSFRQAVSRLRRMTAEILFQPETPAVPIQILGVFEAAGLTFDHLWVMGLSDVAWPLQPRPNPFLPSELQRSQRLPQGSAPAALELAGRLTKGWLTAAGEVVLSHPRRVAGGDHELSPSPLIADIAARESVSDRYPDYRDIVYNAGRLERIKDQEVLTTRISTEASGEVRGGVTVIKDQAACPFRALAVHRLGAEALKVPSVGLTAMERGNLVHHMLAQVWGQIRSKSTLDSLSDVDLDALLLRTAEEAITRVRPSRPNILAGRFALIEQRRLVRLAREWLDEDRKREDFEVVSIEAKCRFELGGLTFSTRLDRVDELPDGRRVVIDYKTRAPLLSAMLGNRPDEPQLPLYLVTAEPDAVAVAFAQVKAGEMRFTALARDRELLPGVKAFSEPRQRGEFASWEDLLSAWRTDLARIAADFKRGSAAVNPKRYPHTCRNCGVRPLCRIRERTMTAFNGEEGE